MSYVVEALLATGNSKIARGIASGIYTRWGGVIRVAAGQPDGGTIVAHLRDVVPAVSRASPPGVAQAASSIVANGQLHKIQSTLGSVLRMTNVAAAASVLNLGVSVAGFAIMAAKLNRLQNDMNRVLHLSQENQREVLAKLGVIEERLVELRFIGLANQNLLADAFEEIRNVRKDLLDGYLARMQVAATHLRMDEAPSERDIKETWRVFTEARHWLQTGIETARVDNDRPQDWFYLLTRFRAWCFAVAGEVQLARQIDARGPAVEIAADSAAQSRQWARRWQTELAPVHEFGGVLRFSHSQFAELHAETTSRLERLQFGEELGVRDTRVLDAARLVAERAPSLGAAWFERQRALAGVLDFVEEATERLESLAEQARWCDERRLNYAQWERLAEPGDSEGVGAVIVESEAA